ncbi:galactosyltransferase-related protein [Microbulbifer thermotolerans]|uniref:galactosyltransferase-related protein n=1 Tax=Microbulbifer thermotolerans TaxID=252514 RepID=UPI00224B9F2D|nr:galactosyltransferase-related protein [Microbulbifer thermotolerans]MCX2782477.1 galactosyltransferase-related protein [Microbulbifer thermotolerans]MCX2836193.1 galactosyltransferase-related protein [Microbulbifer thermotolerans]
MLRNVSAIIPLRLDSNRPDLIDRVERLAQQCQNMGIRVVVVQEIFGKDKPLIELGLDKRLFELVTYTSSSSTFNLAKARNFALSKIKTDWLITLDADLVLPQNFGPSLKVLLASDLSNSETFFVTVPVVYAVENVSASDLSNIRTFGEAVYGSMGFHHWALGSSVILVRSTYIRKLGGYQEAYCGWGYEDHDMAMQLVSRDPTFITPYDARVFDPRPMQDVTRYVGWRAKYALYGYLALNYGLFLLHLHHPKNDTFYNSQRIKENKEKFMSRLKKMDFPIFERVTFDKDSPLYSQYHLYFEQIHLGKKMAAIRSFLLRSRFIVSAYRKIRRI